MLVVTFAFVAEASLGFGSTLLTVTLGASLMPIHELLPAFIPLNLFASLWIVRRSPRRVDFRLLTHTIAPWLLLGLPLGIFAFLRLEAGPLARLLGGVVTLMAARELVAALRRVASSPNPIVQRLMLVAGGLAHGAFGSGGPFVVYVAGRLGLPKEVFRSTLAVLWLALSVVLIATYVADGRIDIAALLRSAAMASAAALGLVIGDRLFQRIPQEAFRLAVFALLFVAGLALVLR